MSYELSISRGIPYSEDGSFQPISESEWNSFIEASEEFSEVKESHGRNPMTGETITIRLMDTARHNSYGFHISLRSGYISTDLIEDLIPEYRKVAESFNAQLYGEEGESY